MAAGVFDYIRNVNSLCEDLLRAHGDLLERKNIWRKQDLIRVIKLDLDKLTHALLEVKENRPLSLLESFFAESGVDAAEVCDRLAERTIYHFGFEIHEPLDLVLHGINHWIEHSKRALGANMRVSGFLRFPASQAFQDRVGAYTEIMRIWLNVNQRVLMLELFDIHRPVDAVLAGAPRLTHRNFHGLFHHGGVSSGHDRRLTQLFAADEIWHYALYVKRPADVLELHAAWQALATHNPNYFVPYTAAVHNQHDGSFHTKIVHQGHPGGARRELEFVTQYGDGAIGS